MCVGGYFESVPLSNEELPPSPQTIKNVEMRIQRARARVRAAKKEGDPEWLDLQTVALAHLKTTLKNLVEK